MKKRTTRTSSHSVLLTPPVYPISQHQTTANPATNPPTTTPTTPTLFPTAAPVLCCAGAELAAEGATDEGATLLNVALAALDALAADLETLDAAAEDAAADDDAAIIDEGRMTPEIVVAMLNAAVGAIAGRLVCVGITRPVDAK